MLDTESVDITPEAVETVSGVACEEEVWEDSEDIDAAKICALTGRLKPGENDGR